MYVSKIMGTGGFGMAKAKQRNEITGPKGERLVVAWMDDGRIRLKLSSKIAISAFFPGKSIKPEAKIVIQPI